MCWDLFLALYTVLTQLLWQLSGADITFIFLVDGKPQHREVK